MDTNLILKESKVKGQDENKPTGMILPPEFGNYQVYSNIPPLKLRGVIAYYADEICNNKNIYPADEVESGIEFWKQLVEIDPTYRYMFINHPATSFEEDLRMVAGYLQNTTFEKGSKIVRADFDVMNTSYGVLIRYLIEHDYPVGLSLRGYGEPTPTTVTSKSGKKISAMIRDNFKQYGIDFVVYPSFMTTQVTQDHVVSKDNSKELKSYLDSYKIENSNNIVNLFENFCVKCSNGNCEIVLSDIKENKTEKTYEDNSNKQIFGGLTNMENLEKEKAKLALERIRLKIQLKNEIDSLQKSEKFLKEQIKKMNEELERVTNDLDTAKTKLKVVLESTTIAKTDMESFPKTVESYKGEMLELEEDTDFEWFEKISPYNV